MPDANVRLNCDLLVVGGNPGGIACAITAAREGLEVILSNHTPVLGGLPANGLSLWDTLYEGRRSPVYDELRWGLFDYYKEKYGEDSRDYRNSLPAPPDTPATYHSNGRYEASVFQSMVTGMVEAESNIRVIFNVYPVEAIRGGRAVKSVTLAEMDGGKRYKVAADAFADCSYEGDLMAVSGTSYRVGRESRDEFDEPHAGHIFMEKLGGADDDADYVDPRARRIRENLNLRQLGYRILRVLDQSTGAGDGVVQAYNYRMVLSEDPENQYIPECPEGYDPEYLKTFGWSSVNGPLPNRKWGWNRPQILGSQSAYPEGDWSVRRKVMDEHLKATFQIFHFLRNDPSVDEKVRERWRGLGFAKDEFPENGHVPHEIYVRESRRLEGRYMFTQHDASLCAGYDRAPFFGDSIAFTEWYMDTHGCTNEKAKGAIEEGKLVLNWHTFPGQLSYRALLPKDIDNLLIPGCVSSTHVAWGTVRLEPTWMNIGESAAHAIVMAKQQNVPPAAIDVNRLQMELADSRISLSFFNDIDIAGPEAWIPAIQYLGTKGFFPSYDANPEDDLDAATARTWAKGAGELLSGNLDARSLAAALQKQVDTEGSVEAGDFCSQLVDCGLSPNRQAGEQLCRSLGVGMSQDLTRGDACNLIYSALKRGD
ncbi:MAG: FAD-dependent oxidoreductase [Candidatus Poribacteria bacterium]|nr:FAD-dependent oxidoreductase [Candidatus Poribacteria bacterium]MDE0504136.1 FAD-dependent oxidoreductase [Candidatus Poribacteria bacterium]